jgi:hypothetical protein
LPDAAPRSVSDGCTRLHLSEERSTQKTLLVAISISMITSWPPTGNSQLGRVLCDNITAVMLLSINGSGRHCPLERCREARHFITYITPRLPGTSGVPGAEPAPGDRGRWHRCKTEAAHATSQRGRSHGCFSLQPDVYAAAAIATSAQPLPLG